MASSESLRQHGNKFFCEFKKCVSNDGKKQNLHKALTFFSDAFKAARDQTSHEDMKSAAKNIFLCHFYLYNLETQLTTKQFCLLEGLKFASVAIHHYGVINPNGENDHGWMASILEKVDYHIGNMWQHSDKLSVDDKIKFISVFGNNFNKEILHNKELEIIAQFRNDQTKITISHGMQFIFDKDFKKGLHLIHEAYFPLQETLKFRKGISNEDIKILQEEYHSFKSLGEGLQSYSLAVNILDEALNSEEELQMEIVWDALDHFRQAAVLSKGESVEFICMAQAKIGEIYYKILKNDKRAKSYFQECITLAHTLDKNNYEDDWYILATTCLRDIQEKFQQAEELAWQTERQKYLDKIKDKIEVLDKNSHLDDKEFLQFIADKFPPTHKTKFQRMVTTILKDENIKKALQKMITVYHTDKISKDEHSMEYFVLCEEISKRLTARYQVHKG